MAARMAAQAFRAWRKMTEPEWAKVDIAPIDYQGAIYYSAPKQKAGRNRSTRSIPNCLRTYEKLGIPLRERAALAGDRGRRGVRQRLGRDDVQGAARRARHHLLLVRRGGAEHPELVRQYLGTVVPQSDNFFAALNSAVFSDGSFAYIPPGVRCPMELSTYFRINAAKTGQFERTLLVADKGAYVSYLEGCTAPQRDENQLHAAVVELIAHEDAADQIFDRAELVSRRCRGQGRHLQFRHQARRLPRRARQDLLDPGRDRFGDHLEIPELHAAKATIRSASSIRSRSPTTGSRPIPARR